MAVTSLEVSTVTVPKLSLPSLVIVAVPLNLYFVPTVTAVSIEQVTEESLDDAGIWQVIVFVNELPSVNESDPIDAAAVVVLSLSPATTVNPTITDLSETEVKVIATDVNVSYFPAVTCVSASLVADIVSAEPVLVIVAVFDDTPANLYFN